MVPIAAWCACIVLTAATGSRMATVALLAVPLLHPLYRGLGKRIVALAIVAILGVALFRTPIIQDRLFPSGQGDLSQLFRGEISGRG